MRRILLATLLALPSCADQGGGATLNYYFTYDPRSLDPALSTDVPTGEVVSFLFDNLTQFDADAKLIPGLARDWETDPSGQRYTFHLRTGATFHDGRPIKATDVRASLLRALAPGVTGGRSWPLYPVRGARAYAAGETKTVDGISVPDHTGAAHPGRRIRSRPVERGGGTGGGDPALGANPCRRAPAAARPQRSVRCDQYHPWAAQGCPGTPRPQSCGRRTDAPDH